MVFTFILLLSPQTFIPVLAKAHIALLTGGLAVVVHWWSRFTTRQPIMRVTRELWLSAVLLIWAAVTIPVSQWPMGSLQIFVDLFLKAVIIFWLLSNTVTTMRRLLTVAWGVSLMAVPLAVTAVRNFSGAGAGASRIVGYEAALTQNPNDLALTLNLILPLTVALFLISRRAVIRGFLAGVIVLDATAVVATFSRGGFLALATILVLYLRTLHGRERRWAAAAVLLALAATPLLPSTYLERLGTITNVQADQTGSAQERVRDTKAAMSFVLSHPITGAGLGMNILALNEIRGAHWLQVHNAYLEYAMDLGWIGLGLFLLLLASCIRTAGRVRARSAELPALRDLTVLAEAIRITLVAFAVAACFHPVAYHFFFFYFGALAVAAGAVYEAEMRPVTEGLSRRVSPDSFVVATSAS